MLVSDPFDGYFELVGRAGRRSPEQVEALWRESMREKLLRGEIPEQEFWPWLGQTFNIGEPELWRELFLEQLYSYLSLNLIDSFSRRGRVVLLSSLRSEWIKPYLEREGVLERVSALLCGNETGQLKPEPEALQAAIGAGGGGPVLYVDNEQESLAVAKSLGADVIFADRELDWVAPSALWLAERSGKKWRGLFVPRGSKPLLAAT